MHSLYRQGTQNPKVQKAAEFLKSVSFKSLKGIFPEKELKHDLYID